MKKLQRRFFILLLLSWAGSFYHRYFFHSIQIDDAQQLLLQHQPQQPHEEEQAIQNTTIRQPAYYRPPQNADDIQSQRSGGNEQMMISPTSSTTLTYADLIQRSMGLPAYTMRQAIDAANTFTAQYAIVVYDPEKDNFKGYYSQNHQWVSSVAHKKLSNTITTLTWLLRKLFPERFTPDSPEFVMALSGGDYPAVRDRGCIRSNDGGPCGEGEDDKQQGGRNNNNNDNNKAPILHFGSVFSGPLFPNLIAMPMPGVHLNCFTDWFTSREVCRHFLPSYLKPGGLVFGEDVGLFWDDLVPQLVWRGTDFPFLSNQNDLEQPSFERYVGDKIDGIVDNHHPNNEVATAILRHEYNKLVPRWKGVVLTAESEIEARQTNTLPRINIKFSHVAGDGGRKRLAKGSTEYQGWEQIGFPVAGEVMPLRELAKYKYHIDLGGGGGTSWTGTFEKLAMPGLLFHHVTPTKDYIHDLLEPWVHYVPVRSDLGDLMQKLEWAESHPNYARQISDNATKFMREIGTKDGFERVFQNNMVKPLRRVIEAYTPLDPTSKKHNGAFRQELTKTVGFNWRKPFIKCSGETRFSCKLIGSWA
ncbi:glycosyltransferase (family 90) [Skeletonema marinoi]|uniref:Glycosyltransferase (Family 90) n=1 Tax=Skeletonema marinoi TaxID=267567 RepID=A0AAD9D4L2_9STRA|nr:glycosyltransferase (family 90) [Skeletonema marinoi]